MNNKVIIPGLIILAFSVILNAEDAAPVHTIFGKLENRVLSTGSGRVRIMDQSGKILWQFKGSNVHDSWMLSNGNILFADGNITEVNPETNEIVFQYKPVETQGGGAYTCQRLANGNTMVGENSTGRILEVDKAGKIVFEMRVEPYKPGNHHNMRMARKLKNGNYLVCHSGEHVVREHTPKGEIVFEAKVDNIAFSAVRLPDGNTLVGHIGYITEFDKTGKEVWKFSNKDLDGIYINMMCGINVLPNGNIAVGVYSAYKDGQGTGLFEITRNKELVWRYSDAKSDGTMMGIQVLDSNGKPFPGDVLR